MRASIILQASGKTAGPPGAGPPRAELLWIEPLGAGPPRPRQSRAGLEGAGLPRAWPRRGEVRRAGPLRAGALLVGVGASGAGPLGSGPTWAGAGPFFEMNWASTIAPASSTLRGEEKAGHSNRKWVGVSGPWWQQGRLYDLDKAVETFVCISHISL
jgi:hypothetical protein